MYLNFCACATGRFVPPVLHRDMGLTLLRKHVMGRSDILSPLRNALYAALQSDRVGERVDRAMVGRLLKMIHDLGMYVTVTRPCLSLVTVGCMHGACLCGTAQTHARTRVHARTSHTDARTFTRTYMRMRSLYFGQSVSIPLVSLSRVSLVCVSMCQPALASTDVSLDPYRNVTLTSVTLTGTNVNSKRVF